jgi:hypothetical protein
MMVVMFSDVSDHLRHDGLQVFRRNPEGPADSNIAIAVLTEGNGLDTASGIGFDRHVLSIRVAGSIQNRLHRFYSGLF